MVTLISVILIVVTAIESDTCDNDSDGNWHCCDSVHISGKMITTSLSRHSRMPSLSHKGTHRCCSVVKFYHCQHCALCHRCQIPPGCYIYVVIFLAGSRGVKIYSS